MSKPYSLFYSNAMNAISIAVACGLLTASVFHLHAEPPENHLVGNLLWIAPAQWEKQAGVTVKLNDATKRLVIESGEKGGVCAAPLGQYTLTPETTLDLRVTPVKGEVTVQIEWFDAKGGFLKATPLATVRGKPLELTAASLAEKAPGDIAAAQFGLKFWLAESAKCEISKALISGPITFKSKDVTLVHRYGPDASLQAEKSLDLEVLDGCWKMRLGADVPVSSFVLSEKIKYNPRGIVLVNILSLSGGTADSGASVSVHVLCWDGAGTFLKEVHLIENVTETGEYESSFAMFEDHFPPETDTISFKVWIGGDRPQATIEGIYYGTLK